MPPIRPSSGKKLSWVLTPFIERINACVSPGFPVLKYRMLACKPDVTKH